MVAALMETGSTHTLCVIPGQSQARFVSTGLRTKLFTQVQVVLEPDFHDNQITA
jgi:hypothetical protein